jgi:hypothetical protein
MRILAQGAHTEQSGAEQNRMECGQNHVKKCGTV